LAAKESAMAEVFISYKSDRRNAAKHLAGVLTRHGYSVWFDYALIKGDDFEFQLDSQLRAAKAVIVLWCSMSVQSAWVSREASLASKLKTLIPALIEDCELKLAHHTSDYVDLIGWDGSPRSPALDPLLNAVARLVGRPPQADWAKLSEYEENWRMFGSPTLAAFALGKPIEVPAADVRTNLIAIAAREWPNVRDSGDINRLRRFELHFGGTYYADEARILCDALETKAEKKGAFQEKQKIHEKKQHSNERQANLDNELSGHKSNKDPGDVSPPPLKEVNAWDRQTISSAAELTSFLAATSTSARPASQQQARVDRDTSHERSHRFRILWMIYAAIAAMVLIGVLSSNWKYAPSPGPSVRTLFRFEFDDAATIVFRGLPGGPFFPGVFPIQLSARDEIHWTSQNPTNWLEISPTSGTIPAGGSMRVELRTSAGANEKSAQPDPYEATISFYGDNRVSLYRRVQLFITRSSH
jgi:hypothetical protein